VERNAGPQYQGISIAPYRSDRPARGPTAPNPPMDQFMAVVNLRQMTAHGLWRERHRIDVPNRAPGALVCLDLRERWTSELPQAFDTFNVYVPRKALDDLTVEWACPRIHTLSCPEDLAIYDQTMQGLAL